MSALRPILVRRVTSPPIGDGGAGEPKVRQLLILSSGSPEMLGEPTANPANLKGGADEI